MKTLNQIFTNWLNIQKKIECEVEQLKKQGVTESFEKHLKEKFGADYPNFWADKILPQVANQIKQAGNFARVDVIGPCGIGSIVFFECFTNEEDTQHAKELVVTPNLSEDSESALYVVDCTQDKQEFAKGTIGALNGMNHPRTPINPEITGEQWLTLLS